ncbi:large ribosomal subunit protein mL48 [Austrofundulus limnaeus]|uniref:Large ribosomal subunit protein mL48 n=1 Tax=Austrofundulus limnaeus TaxID=52670 RepID=A0A2I4CXG9_AUSLI|nr:PREDICTED: 39S ribosomal protein L48, mitochondrial [Austrofundulus limnaeus]
MNSVFRKILVTQKPFVLTHALTLCRATPSIQHPAWCTASVNERQFRSMPTHGIGRWRHLVRKVAPKKKKDRIKMIPIVPATDTAYGTLNLTVSGYDMTVVEHYAQYIHNLCIRLDIRVTESYGLPTKTTEVVLMQEKSTKTFIDSILKTHQRVIQLRSLNTTLCAVFMEVLLKNQPEGVQLSVKEHTEDDFEARFKVRSELEELLEKMKK